MCLSSKLDTNYAYFFPLTSIFKNYFLSFSDQLVLQGRGPQTPGSKT